MAAKILARHAHNYFFDVDDLTIGRFYGVMEHPFFHKHITHLIYDASHYEKGLALHFHAEGLRTRELDRLLTARDDTREDFLYQNLWRRVHAMPLRLGRTPYLRSAGDYHRKLQQSNDGWAYERSAYLAHFEYARSWLVQETIEWDKLHRVALDDALLMFPKLRHLVYGDFRSQARHTDTSYVDLTRRLFGRSEQPWLLTNDDDFGTTDFYHLLDTISENPKACIRSISVGGNPWGLPIGIERSYPVYYCDNHPRLPLNPFAPLRWNRAGLEPYKRMFGNLRELKMPICFEHFDDHDEDSDYPGLPESAIPKMLSWSPNLLKLVFVSVNSIRNERDGNFLAEKGSDRHLIETLFPLHFPSLKYLDLRGWEVYTEAFMSWLRNHASTLRQLRLVDNLVEGSVLDLVVGIGESLTLSGAAFWTPNERLSSRLPYERGPLTFGEQALEDRSQLIETRMLRGRKNVLFREDGDWRRSESFADC